MSEIHHLELKEAVLHDRLARACGCDDRVSYRVALTPGKVRRGLDVCSYDIFGASTERLSRGKVNFKHLVRVYSSWWKLRGCSIDLQLSLTVPIGRQRYMLASLPEFHAQRLEDLFGSVTVCGGISNIWTEGFDPYLACAMRPELFLPDNESGPHP